MRNEPQLITYVDRLAGDLSGLQYLLDDELAGAFGGVHLLPFFHRIDGADAGFDPIEHDVVDSRLGDWEDVSRLSEHVDVMADLIVNHVSTESAAFLDWQSRGTESPDAPMFLTFDSVFPEGATEADLSRIYRPRPGLPFTPYPIAGGSRLVWTTFTSAQADINVETGRGWSHLIGILDRFRAAGVTLVRLDAVGYAIKRAGTSSFMIPETFAFIRRLGEEAAERQIELLVEIHSYFRNQIDIADQVDLVYDFALPPLILHALHRADVEPLRRWLTIRPGNCVTVLDTHDGIGVIDVAPEADQPGLLEPADVNALVECVHEASGGQSRMATGTAASNLDLYQINCTFHSALGEDDDATFIARLIQVLIPGVPQVYYAGLLACSNDMALLEATGVGRDINRPFVADRRAELLERPVVRRLLSLLRWRKENAALFDGEFAVETGPAHELRLSWTIDEDRLEAVIDVADRSADLRRYRRDEVEVVVL